MQIKNRKFNCFSFISESVDHSYQYKCFHQVCDQSIEMNFEFYSRRNGNCTICRNHCNQDLTCSAIECGTYHCLGWKNQKCTSIEEMSIVTRDALQTCIKKGEKFFWYVSK